MCSTPESSPQASNLTRQMISRESQKPTLLLCLCKVSNRNEEASRLKTSQSIKAFINHKIRTETARLTINSTQNSWDRTSNQNLEVWRRIRPFPLSGHRQQQQATIRTEMPELPLPPAASTSQLPSRSSNMCRAWSRKSLQSKTLLTTMRCWKLTMKSSSNETPWPSDL